MYFYFTFINKKYLLFYILLQIKAHLKYHNRVSFIFELHIYREHLYFTCIRILILVCENFQLKCYNEYFYIILIYCIKLLYLIYIFVYYAYFLHTTSYLEFIKNSCYYCICLFVYILHKQM